MVDTPEDVKGQKGFGNKTSKNLLLANADISIEWYQPGMKQMELGHDYKITVVYYVEAMATGRRFMINFDNNVFLNLDNGAATDAVYAASTTCELVKIN